MIEIFECLMIDGKRCEKCWFGTLEIFIANILWLRFSCGDNPVMKHDGHEQSLSRLLDRDVCLSYIAAEYRMFRSKI